MIGCNKKRTMPEHCPFLRYDINIIYTLRQLVFFFQLLEFQHGLYIDGTFQTFLLDLAADLIRLADIAMEQVGIGMAAAGAEESRPAVTAFFLVEHMALAEVLREFRIGHAFVEAAQTIALTPHELMAGIEVAVFGHSEVLVTGTTAGQALGYTRAVGKVHI